MERHRKLGTSAADAILALQYNKHTKYSKSNLKILKNHRDRERKRFFLDSKFNGRIRNLIKI